MTSLSQKLAILGPPRLVAEIPAEREAAAAAFTACGWKLESRLMDWHRKAAHPTTAAAAVHEALAPVSLADLEAAGLLEFLGNGPRCWHRDLPALAKHREGLTGLAFHSPDRIEAWFLWMEPEAPDEAWPILAAGAAPGVLGRLGLSVLIDELAHRAGNAPLLLARAAPGEIDKALLAELGFERGGEHLLFTSRAQAA